MKNKIILTIFIILSFGVFLIPKTFAKDYNVDYFNTINYFDHIDYDDETRDFYIYSMPLYDYALNNVSLSSSYIHASIQAFNTDDDIISNLFEAYSKDFTMYFRNGSHYSYSYFSPLDSPYYVLSTTNNNNNNTLYDYSNLYQVVYRFSFSLSNVSLYNSLKNANFNLLLNVDNNRNSVSLNTNKFIPNTNNNINGFNYRGIFQYTSLNLIMQYTNSTQDISAETMGYNVITFNEPLLSQISNNNNINTYQYYLRLNINMAIKDFVNLKFSYLELSYISINGVRYDYASARQQYNFIYNNIVLYDSNSTLFVNSFDLLNSEFSDYVIDYIDFRIADYTFKSSTYYNDNLGIYGYIKNTSISLYEYNIRTIYDNGYQDGSNVGYNNGYAKGKADGIASNKTGFDNLMFAIADVPMKIISSMLNFELLGFNLMYFFMGIITLVLFIKLMQKFKE